MGYWKWLYNKLRDIDLDQLKEVWWFTKVLGGILIISFSCEVIAFYLFNNNMIALVVASVIALFFDLTWFLYNIKKD